jgi:uncharacterized protein (DUF305 family)
MAPNTARRSPRALNLTTLPGIEPTRQTAEEELSLITTNTGETQRMNTSNPLRSFMRWRLSLLVPIGLILVACGGAAEPTATPQPTEAGAEFDQMFIDMMVPHHQSAIEMATIAQERADHAELKGMASQVIEDQGKEIEQLTTWRQQWFGSGDTPPMCQMPMLPGMAGMSGGHMTMDMTQDVERLRTVPEPFDLAFIDTMIGHHQMAIDAARLAEQQAMRTEIKETAQQIIDKQQEEIDQLNQWRQEWFGNAEPQSTPTP